MKLERVIWVIIMAGLALSLFVTRRDDLALRHTFLAGEHEADYRDVALHLFSKSQAVGISQVQRDYYLAYSGWSDRLCIRLVPKPHMVGGSTSYCFAPGKPVRLISRDQEVE